ncbi:hypothetical protein AB0N61_00385 [Microbacterium sp. NPDC089320]|uniref:hypothetical protein n=1 Tax=Microbacterium sp. NPDC089320 TaxID=3155182 RepID=UPI0034211836
MTIKTNGDSARYQLATAVASSLATAAGHKGRIQYEDTQEGKRVAEAVERMIRYYVAGTVDDEYTRDATDADSE